MDKAKLQQLIDKQLKHIEQIQLRVGGLPIECPPEELAELSQALKNSVDTLSVLIELALELMGQIDSEDNSLEGEIAKARERDRQRLETFESKRRKM